MAIFDNMALQLNQLLARQTQTQKVIVGIVVLAIVGVLLVPVIKLGRPVNYEVLYADLDDTAANQIKKDLDQRGVAFRKYQDERGWTIKVPREQSLDLRLELAPSIDPMGGRPGWDLFEGGAIGETHFRAQINRLRALQGELARTVASLEVVRTANVHLALPEKSVFVKEDAQPKASVLVDLYPQARLSESQVQTIQALVAGTIEGLTRENVTVADTKGTELSRINVVDDQEAAMDQRERLVRQQERQKREYEAYLEDKIVGAFGQVFGANNVAASVNVEFDFTVKEESELKYSPKSVVVAEATTLRGSSITPRMAEGVVGTTTHVQTTDGGKAGEGESNGLYQQELVKNYNVSKTETKTIYAPFQIKRVTAALLVDNPPVQEKDADGNVTVTRSEPLTEDKRLELEEQLKQIINYSDSRPGGASDMVNVSNMRFALPPGTPESLLPSVRTTPLLERLSDYVKYALMLAVALLVFFLLRPMVRSVYAAPGEGRLTGPAGAGSLGDGRRSALDRPESALLSDGAGDGLLAPPPQTEDLLAVRQQALDQQILDLARANPKKVPLVLRAWMER